MNEKFFTEAEYPSGPDCVPVGVVLKGPVTNSDAAGPRGTDDSLQVNNCGTVNKSLCSAF